MFTNISFQELAVVAKGPAVAYPLPEPSSITYKFSVAAPPLTKKSIPEYDPGLLIGGFVCIESAAHWADGTALMEYDPECTGFVLLKLVDVRPHDASLQLLFKESV